MKKSWNKPELTVLVRTRPEEAILGLCKAGAGGPGDGIYLGWILNQNLI